MVSANNAINNTVGASISGVTNTLTVTNGSNTASSAARTSITVGGGSAADPSLNFNVNGVTDFEMGIDNNDSDSFKLSASGTLGTSDTFVMTTAGERTMPLQPSVSAYKSAISNNVTGDGTVYTVICDTVILDRNSDYNNGTGVFTAPVTGVYFFSISVGCAGIVPANQNGAIKLVTTARTFAQYQVNYAAISVVPGGSINGFSLIADMTAGDTAFMTFEVGGGALATDVQGATDMRTSFQCFLLA